MKNIITTLLITLLLAQNTLAAIQAEVSYAQFTTPDNKPYLETYLYIGGKSLTFTKQNNAAKQAQVQISIVFLQDTKVAAFDKFVLNSQTIADTLDYVDMVDLKRFPLPTGNYTLEVSLKDLNTKDEPTILKNDVAIAQPPTEANFSSVMFIDRYETSKTENVYTKGGIDMYPNPLSYYPENANRLSFYTELYNTTTLTDTEFLINYFVRRHNDTQNQIVAELRKLKRQKAAAVIPILADFDISKLPSGNYDAVIEVRNKKNELVVQKTQLFQRSSKLTDEVLKSLNVDNTFVQKLTAKELDLYTQAAKHVARPTEQKYIANLKAIADTTLTRQFLYNFWAERMPSNPEAAFIAYKKSVDEVEKNYSMARVYGYNTDRGRIQLQYGKANDIQNAPNEPYTYPYQIWHYYKIEGQPDVKFVFYNPNTASNDYILIHSDARKELHQPQWQSFIARGAGTDIDGTPNVNSKFGTRIGDQRVNDGFGGGIGAGSRNGDQ